MFSLNLNSLYPCYFIDMHLGIISRIRYTFTWRARGCFLLFTFKMAVTPPDFVTMVTRGLPIKKQGTIIWIPSARPAPLWSHVKTCQPLCTRAYRSPMYKESGENCTLLCINPLGKYIYYIQASDRE